MSEEEIISDIKFLIGDLKASNYNEHFIASLYRMLDLYNKEKEKNEELRNLFNIQKSIARSLNFDDKEKMIQWNNKYYVPDTMEVRKDIDKPSRIILIYVDISNFLEEDNK